MTKTMCTAHRGFTLIELLIVVAILSVLCAIATPNFMEAQTRAKVSRTRADIKTLATALETYRVDNSKYPAVGNPDRPNRFDLYIPIDRRLTPITTPIAYISALPADPYFSTEAGGIEAGSDDYVYAPGNLYAGANQKYSGSAYRNTIFSVSGRGPDRNIHAGGYCMAHPLAFENKQNIIGQYDPTNGTVSEGDVFRVGGGSLGQTD